MSETVDELIARRIKEIQEGSGNPETIKKAILAVIGTEPHFVADNIGEIPCPVADCSGHVKYRRAAHNGHMRAKCHDGTCETMFME